LSFLPPPGSRSTIKPPRAIIAFGIVGGGAPARQMGRRVVVQIFDRIVRAIELMLALLFIVAVLLNFTNVLGRYLFGISLLGSDEVQVFIMVGMTFLGAVVVTQRNQHLRMDVLVGFMPAPVRTLLRIAEQLLLAVLAGFVLAQSYFYARQMLRIGRSSDMAGVPMWIPHGVIALGFGLILIIALSRVLGAAGRAPEPAAKGEAEP
jgi:TRAP-type C4-dicarboxylate transport system permease small subunit